MDYGNSTVRGAQTMSRFRGDRYVLSTAFAAGLSFAQRVSDRFSYGVRLKYAYQDLGTVTIGIEGANLSDTSLVTDVVENAHGEPAIDIGATYDFIDSGVRFGAVIQNVSREVTYVREAFPLPFSVSFSIHAELLELLNKESELHGLTLGVESTHPRDYREKVKFGAEYRYMNTFFVRAGYRINYDQRGLTFGLGLHKKIGAARLRFDYSYEVYRVFGGVNTISIGTAF